MITAWSFHAPATGEASIKLKVARPVGGNVFTIIGSSDAKVPVLGTAGWVSFGGGLLLVVAAGALFVVASRGSRTRPPEPRPTVPAAA